MSQADIKRGLTAQILTHVTDGSSFLYAQFTQKYDFAEQYSGFWRQIHYCGARWTVVKIAKIWRPQPLLPRQSII